MAPWMRQQPSQPQPRRGGLPQTRSAHRRHCGSAPFRQHRVFTNQAKSTVRSAAQMGAAPRRGQRTPSPLPTRHGAAVRLGAKVPATYLPIPPREHQIAPMAGGPRAQAQRILPTSLGSLPTVAQPRSFLSRQRFFQAGVNLTAQPGSIGNLNGGSAGAEMQWQGSRPQPAPVVHRLRRHQLHQHLDGMPSPLHLHPARPQSPPPPLPFWILHTSLGSLGGRARVARQHGARSQGQACEIRNGAPLPGSDSKEGARSKWREAAARADRAGACGVPGPVERQAGRVAKPLGVPRQSTDGEGAYIDVRDRAGYGEPSRNAAPRLLSPRPAPSPAAGARSARGASELPRYVLTDLAHAAEMLIAILTQGIG